MPKTAATQTSRSAGTKRAVSCYAANSTRLTFTFTALGGEDANYILDTFPIVRRKDEAQHSEYRTKRVILEIYDAMQQAITTGQPYQTRLDPPPANGWTPPELIPEEVVVKPVAQPAGITDKKQSDLFAWQTEDPQQQRKFDDIE